MDEECNMSLCDFELEEDDNTEKQSETVEPEKKKRIRLAHLIVGGILLGLRRERMKKKGQSAIVATKYI